MTAEIEQQLQKYMMENGYYDTAKIREAEGMGAHAAKFLAIFGGFDEDIPAAESELVEAAKALNTAKSETDASAERDANTAEAVYEDLMTHDTTAVDEQRVIHRAEHMHPEVLRAFITRIVTELDTLDADTEVWRDRMKSAHKNRILWLLIEMRLGEEYGDIADQRGFVDTDKARRLIAGQTVHPAWPD
jgi:hypothetical protein